MNSLELKVIFFSSFSHITEVPGLDLYVLETKQQ